MQQNKNKIPGIEKMLFEIYNLLEEHISKEKMEEVGNSFAKIVSEHGYDFNKIYQENSEREWQNKKNN